jgi:TonB family protein
MSNTRKRLSRYTPHFIGLGVVLAVAYGLVLFVANMMEPIPVQKKIVREVTLIAPPPPPPPKQIEEPPEPEIEEVEIDEPEPLPEEMPDPIADDTPVGEDLALDADGVAGGDAFGLLAKRGGRDLINSSSGIFSWYASSVQADILELLSENTEIRKREYSVRIQLWVDSAGRLTETRLKESTGDRALDKMLITALRKIETFSESPPKDLPQPINVRVTSRI